MRKKGFGIGLELAMAAVVYSSRAAEQPHLQQEMKYRS
jgi:hypothetical protein